MQLYPIRSERCGESSDVKSDSEWHGWHRAQIKEYRKTCRLLLPPRRPRWGRWRGQGLKRRIGSLTVYERRSVANDYWKRVKSIMIQQQLRSARTWSVPVRQLLTPRYTSVPSASPAAMHSLRNVPSPAMSRTVGSTLHRIMNPLHGIQADKINQWRNRRPSSMCYRRTTFEIPCHCPRQCTLNSTTLFISDNGRHLLSWCDWHPPGIHKFKTHCILIMEKVVATSYSWRHLSLTV